MAGRMGDRLFQAFLGSLLFALCSSCNVTIGINGSFSLSSFSDVAWFNSGPVSFRYKGKSFTTADGSLKFSGKASSSGHDVIGRYTDFIFRYKADDITMETSVKQYQSQAMIVFTQRFPQGTTGSATHYDDTVSGFPSVHVQDSATTLGYLSYGGDMFGYKQMKFGKWGKNANINEGMDGSGPLLVYDKSGRVILISPFDHFMASSTWHDKDNAILNWGIMGGVDDIPAGFESSTIAFCSDAGIREAFTCWGQVMRKAYNKTDEAIKYQRARDITLSHLGYWTDNGAFYFYHPAPDKNYEDTLLAVKQWATANDVPYRYYQLDSWWYPKDEHKAVLKWDAMESVFPHGLRSAETPYAKQNGGLFDFIVEEQISLPVEQAFWDYLLGHSNEEWGLVWYEQDWLATQTSRTKALNTNLTLGHLWLSQMALAGERYGVQIQYCTAMSRHALSSLFFPVVTQSRVSSDYLEKSDQWKIGVTSHFAHAMGVVPFKDDFWTVTVEPGNKYDKKEPNPSLQAAVSTLSTGPVGPSDKVGLTNIPLLMRCCDKNGLILKPSVPARAIDDQFLALSFQDGSGVNGEVWSTFSTQLNTLYGIVLVVNLQHDYVVTPGKAGFLSSDAPKFTQSVLYSVENNTAIILDQKLNSSSQFTIHPDNCKTGGEFFCLFYTSPLLSVGTHSVALLGDLTKWVPMSEQRVVHVWQKSGGLAVTLRGRTGESISFTYSVDKTISTQTGKADEKDCATFTLINGSEPHYPADLDCRLKAPPSKK